MVLANVDFWDVFWLLFIWIPLLLLWAFALIDIFGRDDLSGGWKAVWVLVVILLPFLGTLAYLLFRPVPPSPAEQRALNAAQEAYDASIMAERLSKLAELHDKGKLTDAEFAQAKARLLATASVQAPGPAAPSPIQPGPGAAATSPATGSPWAPPRVEDERPASGDVRITVADDRPTPPSGTDTSAPDTTGDAQTATSEADETGEKGR